MGVPITTIPGTAVPGPPRGLTMTTTLSKGSRITGPARAKLTSQVRRRYEKGEPIRSIASSLGRSYGFVHRLLAEDSVPLRARGGATRRPKPADRTVGTT